MLVGGGGGGVGSSRGRGGGLGKHVPLRTGQLISTLKPKAKVITDLYKHIPDHAQDRFNAGDFSRGNTTGFLIVSEPRGSPKVTAIPVSRLVVASDPLPVKVISGFMGQQLVACVTIRLGCSPWRQTVPLPLRHPHPRPPPHAPPSPLPPPPHTHPWSRLTALVIRRTQGIYPEFTCLDLGR